MSAAARVAEHWGACEQLFIGMCVRRIGIWLRTASRSYSGEFMAGEDTGGGGGRRGWGSGEEYVYYINPTYTYQMKKKLTITVDSELLPRAKRYARGRGVSLSSLVEDSLREMAGDESPSFSARWRGRFEAADGNDPLYRALAKKYL